MIGALPRLAGLVLSVTLHVGLLTVAVLLVGDRELSPLVVDLTEPLEIAGGPEARRADAANAGAPRPRARPHSISAPTSHPTVADDVTAPRRAAVSEVPAAPTSVVTTPTPRDAPAPTPTMAERRDVVPLPAPLLAPIVEQEMPPPPAPTGRIGAAGRTESSATVKVPDLGGGPGNSGRVSSTTAPPGAASPSGAAGRDGSLAAVGANTARSQPTAEYGGYLAQLRRRIQETVRYPLTAQRRGLTGTVHVELVILPSGAVDRVSVVRSSAHPVLDEAAVESVRALPAAPFPPELPARQLVVRLPVVFALE